MSGDDLVWVSPGPHPRYLPYQPCPGDVAAVRAMALRWREQADALDRVSRRVGGWDPSQWQDRASGAATRHLAQLRRTAAALSRSLTDAAAALDGWAQRLTALQAEADALDAEAGELHRRLARPAVDAYGTVTATAQLDWGHAAQRDALLAELAAVERRADDLHDRYVGLSRLASHALDETAPGDVHALDRWDRSVRDIADDGTSLVGRSGARLLDIQATTAGRLSTATGVVGMYVPGPVSRVLAAAGVGLAGVALRNRVVLATVADGSSGAVGSAALGGLLSVAGGAAGAAKVTATARGSGKGELAAHTAERVASGAALNSDIEALLEQPRDEPVESSVRTADGVQVAVSAHSVTEPWHASHGFVGRGFAGVAMTQVPASALRPPVPGPAAPGARPSGPGRPSEPSGPTTRP